MILDVQEELRLRSIKDVTSFEKVSYDKDINTQGIIQFIKKDSDVIKHFIIHQVNWFDHQQVILQYFNDVVEEYDRNAVIKVLESYGFRNRDTKCFVISTIYPFYVAVPITIVMCVGMGLTFGAMLMVFVLMYTFIAAIPLAYVMFYESKRLV